MLLYIKSRTSSFKDYLTGFYNKRIFLVRLYFKITFAIQIHIRSPFSENQRIFQRTSAIQPNIGSIRQTDFRESSMRRLLPPDILLYHTNRYLYPDTNKCRISIKRYNENRCRTLPINYQCANHIPLCSCDICKNIFPGFKNTLISEGLKAGFITCQMLRIS